MNRVVKSFIIIFILQFIIMTDTSEAAGNKNFIFVVVNDEMVSFPDAKPFVSNGKTFVPTRFFADSLGGTVRWSGKENAAYISKGSKQLILYPDKNIIKTEKGSIISYPIKNEKGRVSAPYRFIGQYFSFYVSYIKEGPIARIQDENAKLNREEVLKKYGSEIEEYEESLKPKKMAYITFDDGPNIHTKRILTILDRYDAKATFFMLDGNMRSYKSTVKSMKAKGHGLACHGVTHSKNSFYKSPSSANWEMTKCLNTLKSITGVSSKVIRVPYGSKPYMKPSYQAAINRSGYKMWDWTVDSLDWKFLNGPKTATYTLSQIKSNEKNGIAPIVLFHDKSTTADGLATVLSYLKKNGYTFGALTNDMTPYNFWNRHYIYMPK
jgi:peptidoglycan-N-acetylglucosamine deacetylase